MVPEGSHGSLLAMGLHILLYVSLLYCNSLEPHQNVSRRPSRQPDQLLRLVLERRDVIACLTGHLSVRA